MLAQPSNGLGQIGHPCADGDVVNLVGVGGGVGLGVGGWGLG